MQLGVIPYRIENGVIVPQFHPGQRRAWESKARFVLVLAGTQSGKTSFGPWWLYREILHKGPGDYLAVTTSYDLFKLKMLPALRVLFEDVLKIGRYWRGMRLIELMDPDGRFWAKRADDPMWGRIILRSAASEEGLESGTANAAWLDEVGQVEWTKEVWEAILRRLSLSRGRVLGTTTVYELTWLKTEWYDRWVMGDPDYDVIQFDSIENPAFPREEFERARMTMPSWKFDRFYRGMFSRPSGAVFESFGDHLIVNPISIHPDWPVVVGIDFGAMNTAAVAIAFVPAWQKWLAFWEYAGGAISAVEHAAELHRVFAGYRMVRFFGGAQNEEQFRLEFRNNGIPVMAPPVIDFMVGVMKIIEIFNLQKLVISRDCPGLISQIHGYRWKEESEKIDRKGMFHFVDALRYAVVSCEGSISDRDIDGLAQAYGLEGGEPIPLVGAEERSLYEELDRIMWQHQERHLWAEEA